MKAIMYLIPTTGTSRVANLLVQKSILRGFVTPVFIHLADDNYTVDLASRKGTLSARIRRAVNHSSNSVWGARTHAAESLLAETPLC
jgi:hypothetical protein